MKSMIKPFWNKFSFEVSSRLSLENNDYTQNDISVDVNYKSLNLRKTRNCELKLDLEQNIPNPKSLASKKIRVYPNKNQIKLFLKCFKAHRYIYNKALAHFNETNDGNFLRLHRAVIVNDPLLEPHEKWLKDIPMDTRVQAVRQLSQNIKTAFSNLRMGNITRFKMNFMSKKHSNDIFTVNSLAVSYTVKSRKKELRIFYHRLKKDSKLKISKRSRRWLDETEGVFNSKFNLNHFASVTRQKDGSWYLIIPYDKTPKESKSVVIDDLVALDPGVRTFQTFYSENSYGKLGDDFAVKCLKPLTDRVDKLTSQITKAQRGVGRQFKKKFYKKKYNLRKRCNKIRAKVSNTVLDLHCKTANFLTSHYKVILIPKFETSKMTKTENRVISKTTSKNMYQLSHYAFRQRLLDLSKREKRCEVIVCKEDYTSQTCGSCGALNKKLGSRKVFKCIDTKCNFTLDRDVNGARNIMIKYITELCNQYFEPLNETISN
jgi:putative transposase